MAACAETLTPMVAECGGKDALIVDADADLDAAADAALWGAMSNAGQTCVGVERVYVVDAVYDEFVAQLAERAASCGPAASRTPTSARSPCPASSTIIRGHIDDALDARRHGGRRRAGVGQGAVRRAGRPDRRAGGLAGGPRGDVRADRHGQPGARTLDEALAQANATATAWRRRLLRTARGEELAAGCAAA